MKRTYRILSVFLIAIFVVMPVYVNAIMVNLEISGEKTVKVGETIQLKADYMISNDMVMPGDTKNLGGVESKDVTASASWSIDGDDVAVSDKNVSSNDIIEIDPSGKVTGLKAGKAIVTASYEGTTGKYEITVEKKDNTKLFIIAGVGCCCIAMGACIFVLKSKKINK